MGTKPPTYTGKNEINMARKTITPYYHYRSPMHRQITI